MQPMVTDQTRRKLLQGALGSLALAPFVGGMGWGRQTSARADGIALESAKIIGCRRYPDGRYGVVTADVAGRPIHQLDLPTRGHGVALQPHGTLAVAFSRRPGTYLQVFDYQSGAAWPVYIADHGRHYYGHGVFSPDGRWLYATEGKTASSEGVIGVYAFNATNDVITDVNPDINTRSKNLPRCRKVAEFTGFGIGPHEVILADNDTLAVAVGGVHTRGRTVLNLGGMQPALVYIDRHSGEVVDRAVLADKHQSIRHLTLTASGAVACGQQYRGDPSEGGALIALHRRGGEFELLQGEEEQWMRFNRYIASIASLDGHLLATSPRGNCYGIWNEASRELVALQPLTDASGVGVNTGQWLVGSGAGKVFTVSASGQVKSVQSPVMWDNHWNTV